MSEEIKYSEGDKVKCTGDPRTYDFGYYSNNGHCVLYYEGERNMQDSFAIKVERVYPADAPWLEDRKILHVETQIIDNPAAASYYGLCLSLAKQAGYTHVYDNWGVGAHDELTIDEAIAKYEAINKPNDDDELPF